MKGRVLSVRPLLEPRKYLLTGTPVSESPANAYTFLSVLSPERIPSKARFDQHFITKAKVEINEVVTSKVVGYDNLEELKRMIEAVSVRRLQIDVRGMPDRTEDVRTCEPTREQADHYESIMRGILAEIEGNPDWAKTIDIACVKLLRARQVLNHPGILGLSGDSGKYLELDLLIDEIMTNPEAKVVVWAEWNRAIDLLADRYRRYGTLMIDRRTNQDEMARMERTFDTSNERIVVATPAKGGTGIDFLARARTSIYVERTYSLVNHRQSIDRIVRRVWDDEPTDSAQTLYLKRIKRSPASIIYLHVPGSVDDVVAKVLQIKIDLGDALLTRDEQLIADGRQDLIRMLRERVRLTTTSGLGR